MSDTCTLSQLSPLSLTTVSVSPRWVIPVLYHSYHLCLWLLLSPRWVIPVLYHSHLSLTVLYQYHQDEWYLYSITVITYVSDYCISITKMSDTCTLSQLSPCLTVLSPRWVIPVSHSYNLSLTVLISITKMSDYDYCISITKMSDTCTLSQLSPMSLTVLYQYHQDEWYLYSIKMSLTTVSVSPRWVIPVLYHSYHLCLWLYCISITKMSDTCTLSQLSPMSLTVLYQYHQDEWYLYSITVSPMSLILYSMYHQWSPRWVIPVLYHSYHLCLWLYCISITKMSDTCTLSQLSPTCLWLTTVSVSPRWVIPVLYQYHKMSDTCTLSQLSPMSLTTVSVSPRWVIPVLYHSYHLCLWLYCISITKMSDTCTLSQLSPMSLTTVSVSPRWVIPVLYHSYHLCLWLLYQYHQDEWYLYSITVITYVSDSYHTCISITSDHSITVITWLYCISITKMSDTCTLSQLSPMSLTTVSVSPRWVIPVLYHSMSLTVLYQYHQDEWYLYSITVITYHYCIQDEWYLYSMLSLMSLTVLYQCHQYTHSIYIHHLCTLLYCISITKMSDTCTLSQLSPMSLTVLYQYHQDECYTCTLSQLSPMSLTVLSVSPRWVIPVLYHSYHLCLWLYCISITKMSDTCTLSQLSPVSDCTVSVSPRWVIPVLYHSYHLCLWLYCISITKMSDTCTLSQLSQICLPQLTLKSSICSSSA